MDLAARFQAYADDFERAYADGNWLCLAPYFADDAVYQSSTPPELAFRIEGRAGILTRFKEMTESFDRRFTSRTMRLGKPEASPHGVTVSGVVIYAVSGAPPFELPFTETAEYRGDRIVLLEDSAPPEAFSRLTEWLARYGSRLTR